MTKAKLRMARATPTRRRVRRDPPVVMTFTYIEARDLETAIDEAILYNERIQYLDCGDEIKSLAQRDADHYNALLLKVRRFLK